MHRIIISTIILSLSSIGSVMAEKKVVDEKLGIIQFLKFYWKMQDLEKDLEVEIPLAEGKKGVRGLLETVIEMQADGTVSIDEKIFTLDELEKKFKLLVRVNKDQAVRIRGNANVEFDKVVKVIDRCRKAGIWNISFSTTAAKKK